MSPLSRVLFGGVLLATGTLTVASDDPYEPMGEHFQVIYDCLEASRGAERPDIEHDCVGIVAGPCLDDPANHTTHDMAGCSRREEIIWDRLLNDWYRSARSEMSTELQTNFRDVQRAWIRWRDKKCSFEHARFEGGTMGIPVSTYCSMEMTARRALELRDLVIETESR